MQPRPFFDTDWTFLFRLQIRESPRLDIHWDVEELLNPAPHREHHSIEISLEGIHRFDPLFADRRSCASRQVQTRRDGMVRSHPARFWSKNPHFLRFQLQAW